MTKKHDTLGRLGAAGLFASLLLAGCGSGSSSDTGTVTVQGDVALAYTKRVNTIGQNPTNGSPSAAGGDLMVREKSSPSAVEHNLTAGITQGNGDASDPEVSYDGTKIVFALKCPATNTSTIVVAGATVPACTGRWNLWEYDFTGRPLTGGSLRRLTHSTQDDDVDPAYLPGGRGYVFASNRQTTTKTQALGQTYYALDEYERERVLNLHTMDKDGAAITQISVNQSHDRNPVVLSDGNIMFSRWEHVGERNRFAIFTVKPDGTNMFVKYGAHSPGNSFLHPREMDPAGADKGFVLSSLMSLSGTREGGSLMKIDAANYSEQNTPASRSVPAQGGQKSITPQALNDGRGLSRFGRITTPYPLWDGTGRILTSYVPCQVTKNGVVTACANLSSDEVARLESDRTMAEEAADPVQDDVPPSYGVYMFNPADGSFLPVATPAAGFMYTDAVPLQKRTEPNTPPPAELDAALAARGKAILSVRSVYDTDGLDRMGDSVLAAADLPTGCTTGIAKTAATDASDTRAQIADLSKIKDPADPAYHCAPARMIRAVRAVAPQAGTMGMREAIGETEFEPQQILGYAPIEPDGSFKLEVPADVPLALAVIDAKGRALQTHLNWIQVRPGELRTCDGCHSPRRGAAINAGATVNNMPASLRAALASQHQSGETMASLRTRLDAAALQLQADMAYADIWADTTRPGITARAPMSVRYTGNANAADDLATPAPVDGIINYPDHIQPLWTRSRGAGGAATCTNCHADPARLDLRANVAGTGRLVSYEELLVGDPLLDAAGQPVTRIEEGVPVIVRGAALVDTMVGGANGITRSSRLGEILYGENLKASAESRTLHPNPPGSAPNHATLLNAAELRLVTEWMDLGGQYFNNVSASNSPVRQVTQLSEATFTTAVLPVLRQSCVGCHQPRGSSGAGSPASFQRNRFILTGDAEGDYNVTLTMISNTCQPASNALLARPSTAPHPQAGSGAAPLPAGSAGYTAISTWIQRGCPTP
ncbi:MAG TPA: hypothetical protein VFR90_08665 [Methylibium sp.]|uniref:HzsA-related protein n=1 Tax=Methylibium sp. TaxID=2067992 RepID=UPI002DBC38A9|nr:hypothetical protein [Methylibium sp.]HEU4459178.1 hypothetical protein [Methylibium sp.]